VEKIRNALKYVIIAIFFPLFLHELGRYIDEIMDAGAYDRGGDE